MKNQSFTDEIKTLDREMEKALLLDTDSARTGRAARAFWKFVGRCINEAFAIITTADNASRLAVSDDSVSDSLRQAEEEISRGVCRLALLLADPNIGAELQEEFQQEGIVHPFHSHLGFRIRHDPALSTKARRFFDKQQQRGKSLDQIKKDMRLLFTQLIDKR